MEQFAEELSSPYFWIVIIVIPLIVGIVGQYMPRIAGALFGRVSKTAKRWSEKAAFDEAEAIMSIMNDPNGFIHGVVSIFVPAACAIMMLGYGTLSGVAWSIYLHIADFNTSYKPEHLFIMSMLVIYIPGVASFYFFIRSVRKIKIYSAARILKAKQRASEEKRRRDIEDIPF